MAAHAELLRHDEIKPYATALLGHSEGGLLALAAAAAMGKRAPYALVLAGTPGRPLIDIVRRQIARTAPQLQRRRRAHHEGDPRRPATFRPTRRPSCS